MKKKPRLKVLILGSNPSRKGGSCPSMRKLKDWLDVLNLDIVSFCNVSHKHGPVSLKDVDHVYVRKICTGYDKIVTLGTTANYALVLMGIPHGCLPHPSGLNRQLNQSGFIEQKIEKCLEYLWT